MEDINQIRKSIQVNIHYLCGQSTNLQVLLTHLLNSKVISQTECTKIIDDQQKLSSSYDKFCKLYLLVLQKLDRNRRSEKICQLFITALEDSGNGHIVIKLNSSSQFEKSVKLRHHPSPQKEPANLLQDIDDPLLNNLPPPPLKFISVHQENIHITQNGTIARRKMEEFCFSNAIAFTDRAIKVNEKICLKFIEISNDWSGFLRFGVTNLNPCPKSLRHSWPLYLMPDLTSQTGYWVKSFSEYKYPVKINSVLIFYFDSSGNVHFEVDGEDKGIFLKGVDTRLPLWGVFDLYGNTIALELISSIDTCLV